MLYTHATIITVNTNRDVFINGAILVRGNLIADVGKSEELIQKYPEEETYNLEGHIVIPGLISTHMHTAQTLLRGSYLAWHHNLRYTHSNLLIRIQALPMISS